MNQQHFTNRQSSQRSNFLLTQILKKGDREQFTLLRPRSITRSSLPAVSLLYARKHLQRKVLGCADALKCAESGRCETALRACPASMGTVLIDTLSSHVSGCQRGRLSLTLPLSSVRQREPSPLTVPVDTEERKAPKRFPFFFCLEKGGKQEKSDGSMGMPGSKE